jgi:hypothetical protein
MQSYNNQGGPKNLKITNAILYILPIIASVYNNTVHSTIKIKPIEVTKAKEKQILTSIYNQTKITTPSRKFIVGNFVRISKAKYIFNKGNTPWIGQQSYLKLLKYNLQIPQHIC